MRILYHHRTAGDRVEYVHIMGMVRAFRALGHTVEISSPPGCDPERERPTPVKKDEVKPKEGMLRGKLKRFARKAPNILFELAELLYNCYGFYDCIKGRFKNGKPALIYERTTSNSIVPTFLARWWKIPIVQEVNVTTGIGRLRPLVLRRITCGIERWMIKRTTAFLTVSEHFKQMMVDEGFPAERILVCQNAIDPTQFDPDTVEPMARPDHIPEDALIVGYVGAFVPYHRLDRLMEIARDLAPKHPKLRWLLVGDGVERPMVEKLLDEYDLRDRFWMPGSVVHEQIPNYVNAMDIAILPHSEQFNSPMKLFEYLSMGKPVVVPDVPAIREVIEDDVNGLRFEAGNIDGLFEALQRAIDDPDLRSRLGKAARKDILENYTWQRNAIRLIEFIQQLAQQRKDSA
jgi:glycosyltransferase involved in cell wall biosynthesis